MRLITLHFPVNADIRSLFLLFNCNELSNANLPVQTQKSIPLSPPGTINRIMTGFRTRSLPLFKDSAILKSLRQRRMTICLTLTR